MQITCMDVFFYRSEVAAVADEGANASSTGNIVEVKATSARITFSSFCIAHSFFLFIYCTVLYCIVALVIFPDLIDDILTCRQTTHVCVWIVCHTWQVAPCGKDAETDQVSDTVFFSIG